MTALNLELSEKKEIITNLLNRYTMVVDDHNRISEWPDFFDEISSYYIYTKENYELGLPLAIVMDDSKGRIKDRIKAVQVLWKNHFDNHTTLHTISAPLIQFLDEQMVEVTTNFTVSITKLDRGQYAFSGKYLDKVVLTKDKAAKFAERKVILDCPVLPTYFVFPL